MGDPGATEGGVNATDGGRIAGPALEASVRAATHDDVPAIRAILAAHGNDGPIENGDIVGPYLAHFIDHAIARVSVRDGEVVAYGAAIDTGRSRHLADLFVRQDLLGRGIGRPLLDAVFGDAVARTTFASDDPRALPIYVRAGMSPLWPMLYLRGDGTMLRDSPGADLLVEAADADHVGALERAWTGADRMTDHRHWSAAPEVDAFAVLDGDGSRVAAGYARARQIGHARTINRLVLRPDAEPVGPMLAAIARASRGGPVVVAVPGPNPVLPVLLGAGFRIDDHDVFMASEPGLVDPLRTLPNSGML
jgi:GNAT superfamily N-acetyltransferase